MYLMKVSFAIYYFFYKLIYLQIFLFSNDFLEYISTITSIEINGYYSMLEYAQKLLKTKKPDVGEGITRPKHLLIEFEVK